ncbi:hypothetical protein Bca4012_068097 [Brassica carinata]
MRIIENPCLPPVGIVSGQLAPWIVWHVWTARNKLIFNDKVIIVEEVVTQAVAAAREWLNAQKKEGGRTSASRTYREASSQEVIVHLMQHGRRRTGFQGLDGLSKTREEQKALAMRATVRKSKELGLRHIRCESDSAQLIKALRSTTEPPEIYGIVADIRIERSFFESFSFVWIPRGGNSVADRLAKQALCLVTSGSTTLL